MAEVKVFVDDAVTGTLPQVCAKDGVRTGDRLTLSEQLGDRAGLGVAWLLLLLGPLGWLGLVIISVVRSGRAEVLTIELPLSEPAYQRLLTARRLRKTAIAVAIVGAVAVLWLLTTTAGDASSPWRAFALVPGALVIAATVGMLVAERRVWAALVGVDLDASRRWVTLSRVHPAFVAACKDAQRQDSPRRR